MKKEAIIQFSGGIDSLYTAYLLGQQYDRVHLLTFYKGYLHFGMNFSKPNVENLKQVLGPEKVVFKVVDMKELFRRTAVANYRKNSREFGNEIAWCIPCRASMAVSSIIYALENQIPDFTDGANWEQAPDQENLLVTADNYPGYLSLIKGFADSFRVNYFSPVYKLNSRADRRRLLLEMGFKIDWNSLDVDRPKAVSSLFKKDFYRRYQPMCISGWLTHWKRNLLNRKEDTTEKRVLEFISPQLKKIQDDYIPEYFRARGRDINQIIAQRD